MPNSVLIVGAGIVGAALACRLAGEGLRVTLVEAERPAAGVTGQAFAWINASGAPADLGSPAYAALRRGAAEEWRRLEAALPGVLSIDWCGALTWSQDSSATEADFQARAAEGHRLRLLEGREITRLEPALAVPPPLAVQAIGEGALDPVAATRALVRAAGDQGARFLTGCPVTALKHSDGRVTGVVAGGETLRAERVVLAAGLGSLGLARGMGLSLPLADSPSIWLAFDVPRPLLRGIVSGPAFEARQGGERRLLAAEDFIAESGTDGPDAVAGRALEALRRSLSGGERLELADYAVGRRPMPRDGLPILGPVPEVRGLWLALLHAGITLAPQVARLTAGAMLREEAEKALEPFGIGRFQG